MNLPSRVRWLWLTLAVVILDRATKAWFENRTDDSYHREIVARFIYLVHERNPGIAFSFFAGSSNVTRWILVVGSLVIISVLAWMLVGSGAGGNLTAAGLALLLGGATGNVTDRILNGAVTDFLEIWLGHYRWPAFNVADSAIAVGATLVILDVFFGTNRNPGPRPHSDL